MHAGLFKVGLFAWGSRRSLARLLLVAVGASLALPVLVVTLVAAALSPQATAAAGVGGTPVPPMAAWIVTQGYGCTGFAFEPPRGGCAHFHFGIDLAAPPGAPVLAVLPGQVEIYPPAGLTGGYGLHVVVRHGQGVETMYAHLADVVVSSGQVVAAGEELGHEGSSGLSTGPHLHFETREAGIAVDPVSTLPGIFGPGGKPR